MAGIARIIPAIPRILPAYYQCNDSGQRIDTNLRSSDSRGNKITFQELNYHEHGHYAHRIPDENLL